eukprot:13979150-Alexandrium_andersonii.AAC.1
MSASLVGSEMCIRDRERPPACVSLRADSVFADETGQPARPRCLAGGSGAVSYTHLTLPTICSV